MLKEFNPKKVFAVGSVCVDNVRGHSDVQALGDFKLPTPAYSYKAVGGGGGNFCIALRDMAAATSTHLAISLCTKIGIPPEGDEEAREARSFLIRALHGIQQVDAICEQKFRIPESMVISYAGGRCISPGFTEVAQAFSSGTSATIEAQAAQADLVFVHTRYPNLGHEAVMAARKHGKPVLVDYSVSKWPSDPTFQNIYTEILQGATYVVAPAESMLPGMTEKADPADNAAELRDRLYNNFGVQNVAVSNNSHPVLGLDGGCRFEIQIVKQKAVDTLGVGDAGNAAGALGLVRGLDFETAMRMRSTAASYSVTMPGREWLKNFAEFAIRHPAFADAARQHDEVCEPRFIS